MSWQTTRTCSPQAGPAGVDDQVAQPGQVESTRVSRVDSSARTPTTCRSSASAWRAASSTDRTARRAAAGSLSRSASAAWLCTTIIETRWATTSWSSEAMRWRSASAPSRAASSRCSSLAGGPAPGPRRRRCVARRGRPAPHAAPMTMRDERTGRRRPRRRVIDADQDREDAGVPARAGRVPAERVRHQQHRREVRQSLGRGLGAAQSAPRQRQRDERRPSRAPYAANDERQRDPRLRTLSIGSLAAGPLSAPRQLRRPDLHLQGERERERDDEVDRLDTRRALRPAWPETY